MEKRSSGGGGGVVRNLLYVSTVVQRSSRDGGGEQKVELEDYKDDPPCLNKLVALKHEKAILLRKNKSLENNVRSVQEELRKLNEYNASLLETIKYKEEIEKQSHINVA